MPDPCSSEAFEARYAHDPDPWGFATSPYELARYDALLAVLGRRRYSSAYEPACSIGVLTSRLATRCDSLLAVDVSATAVDAARRRCRQFDNVTIDVGSVSDVGIEEFDLVVFSELGYYFDLDALDDLIARLVKSLVPAGELVACHWTGESDDHRLRGDVVHGQLAANHDLLQAQSQLHDGFLLETWHRR